MTGTRHFLIDAEACTACALCVIACKDEHAGHAYAPWTQPQPETGHFWIDLKSRERGRLPRVRIGTLPLMCQHCANAACMKVCPEDAIARRPDGLVWIDQVRCTGCGLCQQACPYDVIYMNAELGVAQKCTGCAHRVDEGELPRCVEVCPHDAIRFGPAEPQGEVLHPEYLARPLVTWHGLPRPWIAGSVVDAAADELLAGADVTAVDLFDDSVHATQTDAFGTFWIKGLVDGHRYRVEIAMAGYRTSVSVVTVAGEQDLGDVSLTR